MIDTNRILNESLYDLNLKIYKCKPSGNCFFTAIAKYFKIINKPKGNAGDIRKNVIQYIKNNNDIILYIQRVLGISIKEIDDELYELRKSGVYDLEIFDLLPIIIADQYNIKVSIYTWMELSEVNITDKDKETYCPINYSGNELNEVFLLYSNLEHYDLLYEYD